MSKENIYEITENNGIIYIPQWAIGLQYHDHFIEFAWCEVGRENDPDFVDHSLRIQTDNTKQSVNNYQELFNVVQQIRMNEIYDEIVEDDETYHEMGVKKSVELCAEEEVADLVEEIFERVQEGEFLGQQYPFIYIGEVAKILKCSAAVVLNAVDNILIPQKRLGLDGFILISYETYENNKKDTEEWSGHKYLSMSDLGYWYCAACDKSGDEYVNPSDVVCE